MRKNWFVEKNLRLFCAAENADRFSIEHELSDTSIETFLLFFSLYVIKIELGLIYLPHQSVRHWPSIRFSNDSKFHPFCESAILHTLTLVSNSPYSLFGSMIFLFCPRLGERVSVRRVRVRDRRLFWFIVQKRLIPRSALFEEKKRPFDTVFSKLFY